jgi:acetyl-CoA C-acetyltransferase
MCSALRHALDDAGDDGARGFDEMATVNSIGWATANPSRLVSERLGLKVRRTRRTAVGGDVPQKLVHELSRRILASEIDSAVVLGAEALYSANLSRHEGIDLSVNGWQLQDDTSIDVAPPEEPLPFNEDEFGAGLAWPTEMYPLFENARRARLGWSFDEQREHLGRLWARFAHVAAQNPYAWIQSAPSAEEISTASVKNRYVGFPYTKLLNANLPVDMGAAFVIMSVEEATRRDLSSDRWIFPLCGAEGYDHWFVSERPQFDDSPAMRAIWSSLNSFGVRADELSLLDLYSCFPTVVQSAAEVMKIDPLDPQRSPTVTGGLTFAGGPGNNYVTHSIATMVSRLREQPGALGLVTSLGWYATKHAWGVYSSEPPQRFQWRHVQDEVDAQPKIELVRRDGQVNIESYVVSHRKDGGLKKLVAATRHADGSRSWARSDDVDLMAAFEQQEFIGSSARVADGILSI